MRTHINVLPHQPFKKRFKRSKVNQNKNAYAYKRFATLFLKVYYNFCHTFPKSVFLKYNI